MSEQNIRICPRCGKTFTAPPAISRADDRTEICPDCGIREALETIGIKPEEQERILGIIHRSSPI